MAQFRLGAPQSSLKPGRRPTMLNLGGDTATCSLISEPEHLDRLDQIDAPIVLVEDNWDFKQLEGLRRRGKRVFFITNSSNCTCASAAKQLREHGCAWVDAEHVLTSSWAAADFLATFHPSVAKAYVLGSSALIEELDAVGVASSTSSDVESGVGAVVCGADHGFTYQKLAAASTHLQRGAVLVGTDRTPYEETENRKMPACGSLLAAIEASVDYAVEAMIAGMPSQLLLQRVVEKFRLKASRTVMIGSVLGSELSWARAGGLATMIVGGSTMQLESVEKDRHPDYVLESFDVLDPKE